MNILFKVEIINDHCFYADTFRHAATQPVWLYSVDTRNLVSSGMSDL